MVGRVVFETGSLPGDLTAVVVAEQPSRSAIPSTTTSTAKPPIRMSEAHRLGPLLTAALYSVAWEVEMKEAIEVERVWNPGLHGGECTDLSFNCLACLIGGYRATAKLVVEALIDADR